MTQSKKIKDPGQKDPVQKRTIKFRSKYNYILTKKDQTNPKGKSQTIQNTAFSIRELLEKYTVDTGYPIPSKNGTFDENVTHETEIRQHAPDFDLTDETILQDEAQITIQQVIDQNTQIKKQKTKQKEEADFQQKLKEHNSKASVRKANPEGDDNSQPTSDKVSKNGKT